MKLCSIDRVLNLFFQTSVCLMALCAFLSIGCAPRISAILTLSYSDSTGYIHSPLTITPAILSQSISTCEIKSSGPNSALFPSTLSIDPTTCVITGTPTASLASTQFTVLATDESKNTATATFTLFISPCDILATPYGNGTGTSTNPYLICSDTQLQNSYQNLSASFLLTKNIDLTHSNLAPIGSTATPFTGVFDGGGFILSNWTYVSSGADSAGLFSDLTGTLKNLNLVNFNLSSSGTVGLLVGDIQGTGLIQNCTVSGTVSGQVVVGGMIGGATLGQTLGIATINSSSSTARVYGITANNRTGGLLGLGNIQITNSFATGDVTCTGVGHGCGGLIGAIQPGSSFTSTIQHSYYSKGTVNGSGGSSGGLVGRIYTASISDSFSTGSIQGTTGGAVGGVAGSTAAGNTLTLTRVYAAGPVGGGTNNGGLLGLNQGTANSTHSYWDTQVTGPSTTADSGSSVELTTAMQTQSTYSGWDFINTWYAPVLGNSYPTLR